VSNVRAGIGVGVLLGLTLSALLMLMATAPSQAQTEGTCQEAFTVLRDDTESVPITGGKIDKERAGLLKLVDDAQALASIGKTSDAVKKLSDFTVKVDQLEAAGRISADSAYLLRSDAQATIACVQGSDASTAVGATSS
jgi:hypothetical protein